MSRIAAKFAEISDKKPIGLITYLTCGYPDVESTTGLVSSMVEGGADVVELGVPFSDPLADGATIQRASYQALHNGVSVETCLEIARRVRDGGVTVPLLFMGYYNPILSYGLDRFSGACQEIGVDGLIIPDLPPDEATDLRACCLKRAIDLVFLLAPTSTDERIEKVAQMGSGFVYCVSIAGVTGARRELSASLPEFLARVRRKTDLPIAVGFGVSTPEHVRALAPIADAAVVGSAIIDRIESAEPANRQASVRQFVRELLG